MKRFSFISVSYPKHPHRTVNAIFAASGIGRDEYDPGVTVDGMKISLAHVRLPHDDPRLGRLTSALDQAGIAWSTRPEIDYEREDLEAAEFLILEVNVPPKGDTGPEFGTKYDLSTGCRRCGTGATQTTALRLSKKELSKKHRVGQPGQGETIIDKDLATELRIDLRGGRGLRQCEDRESHKKIDWWQVLPDFTMPRMDGQSQGVTTEEQCPACKREGFFHDADASLHLVYRLSAAKRKALPDFVETWECYGHSLIVPDEEGSRLGFAQPSILVSNRVMRVFLKHKVKGVGFIPILFAT